MRYIGILLLVLSVISCDYFEKKKINAEDLLEEELQSFNWNEVDEYPSFASCDSSASKVDRKQCFESVLAGHISLKVQSSNFVVSETIHDTILMSFVITAEGTIRIKEITHSDLISDQIPEIDSILKASIIDLPKLFPAIKRGQQVTTEFVMPLVINTD